MTFNIHNINLTSRCWLLKYEWNNNRASISWVSYYKYFSYKSVIKAWRKSRYLNDLKTKLNTSTNFAYFCEISNSLFVNNAFLALNLEVMFQNSSLYIYCFLLWRYFKHFTRRLFNPLLVIIPPTGKLKWYLMEIWNIYLRLE